MNSYSAIGALLVLLCEQSVVYVAWRRCGGRDAASGCCPEAPLRAALCALLSLLGVLSGALCVSLCFFVTVGSRPAVSASLPLSVLQRQQRRETEAENEASPTRPFGSAGAATYARQSCSAGGAAETFGGYGCVVIVTS